MGETRANPAAVSGAITAPVLMVGWQIAPDEQRPFTTGCRLVVPNVLQRLGVGRDLVCLTTLVRTPLPVRSSDHRRLGPYGRSLWADIRSWGPRTVIFLGAPVACHVLDLEWETPISELRGARYVWPGRTTTSFFVVQPPEDVDLAAKIVSPTTVEWVQDLRAIFEADTQHYREVRVLQGKSRTRRS